MIGELFTLPLLEGVHLELATSNYYSPHALTLVTTAHYRTRTHISSAASQAAPHRVHLPHSARCIYNSLSLAHRVDYPNSTTLWIQGTVRFCSGYIGTR